MDNTDKRPRTREEWLAQFLNRTPKPPPPRPPVEICGIVLNPETDEVVHERNSSFGNRGRIMRTPDGHEYAYFNRFEIRIGIDGETWGARFGGGRWRVSKWTRARRTEATK